MLTAPLHFAKAFFLDFETDGEVVDLSEANSLRITRVERIGRKRQYRIHFDDEQTLTIHEDLVVKHRLLAGNALDSTQLRKIEEDQLRHEAIALALRMIERRARSAEEIRRKLIEKNIAMTIIQETIHYLVDKKYINDEQYAIMLTEQRVLRQQRGRNWVKRELAQKGLSRANIDQAISQISADDEFEAALGLAEKRWARTTDKDKWKKTIAYLLRRGYSYGVASRAMKQLLQNEEEESAFIQLESLDSLQIEPEGFD